MKSLYSTGVSVAGVMVFSIAAFAQAPQELPAPNRSAAQAASADQQVTVSGCIQREADFRKARDAGKGGVAGTGIGVGNEFVLINASMSTGPAAPSPAGTSGSTMAYELTGKNEGQADKFVGQRVEIMGTLKAAEVNSAGRPTGGPTAGKPPEGVDIAGGDLKLRELEITSIKQTAGTCPK